MRLTIPQHRVTLAGNSTSAGAGFALISSGTLTLAGGNAITLSQNGNAVTISGAAGAGATAISGLANSETTYTSGTVSLSELGAITIRSTTGQAFQFSVNSQTVQTQNVVDVTLSGNTAGVLALISSGTMTLAGGNNIVLSQAGNAITISASSQSVQPETQTFIGGISASDTLYTSGTVRITGVGGGITVSSNTGQRIDLSVAAQSVQPETQTFLGGLGTSQTTYTSGTVNLSVVAGNLTIRSTTGQAFQFSMSQTVQPETQTAISGIANSQTTYTSGTVSLSELGAITIRSTTGNQYQLSVNAQTTQTQGILSMGVSTGGNTAGNTTVNTGSRFVLVASGNATASQATAAGASTVTISVGTQTVQTQNLVAVTLSGNTAGALALISSGTMTLAGGNNITLSQAGNAVTISGSAQSVQPETQTFLGGLGNSQTTYTSGTVNLSVVAGNLTIRSTTGQAFQFSMSQTVQAETQTAISGIANSQTTYTSGSVSLSELGAITIRSTTGNQYQL